MAIIECGECGRNVSSSAKACPSCGYPVARNELIKQATDAIKRLRSKPQEDRELPGIRYLIEEPKARFLLERMTEAKRTPSLFRINGIGSRMGKVTPVASIDGHVVGVSLSVFTFAFVPVIPMGWYMVEDCGGAYRFLGKVTASTCNDVFGSGFAMKAFFKHVLKCILIWGAVLTAISMVAK